MAESAMQESVRRAREEARRQQEEIAEQRRRQEEELRRQQGQQQRRNEEMMRQTQVGQAQQTGLGGGMSPSAGMGIAQNFMGGGAAGGGGAAAGGSAAGSGASAGGSALSSAGPWGLLAAAVIGNEYYGKKSGRRNESGSKWARDLVTGKVLEQDMDHYGDKVGGTAGSILRGIGKLGNPSGTRDLIKKIF